MIASITLVLCILAGIIIVIVVRGASSLNLSMLIQTPEGGYYLGKGGGIANAIVGSLYLAFGASLLSFLLGLPIAFALQKEYLGRRLAHMTRLSLDILWGTPSIVYGAFGFIIMVYLGLRASLLGGIITLALLMLPIMIQINRRSHQDDSFRAEGDFLCLGNYKNRDNAHGGPETSAARNCDGSSPCFWPRVSETQRLFYSPLATPITSPDPSLTRSPLFPSPFSSRWQHPSLKFSNGLMPQPSSCW